MKNFVILAGLVTSVLLSPAAAFAQATPYTSYSGGQNASTPGAAAPATPVVATSQATPAAPAPVTPNSNTVTTINAPAPAGATTTDTKKIDPCKDYMYDMNAYTTCQDRMQKYARLRKTQQDHDAVFLPPPAPAPAPAAAPAPVAAVAPPATGATPPPTTSTPSSDTTTPPATTPAVTPPATTTTPSK